MYDLLTHGSFAAINGALFTHFTTGGGGAGNDTFLSMADKSGGTSPVGVEEAYNTGQKPLNSPIYLDAKEPTRELRLDQLPLVNVGGVQYREVALDLNESANQGHAYIVLNDVRVYTSALPNLTGYNIPPGSLTLGGQAPIYDMNPGGGNANAVLLDAGGGSGTVDMTLLIPNSVFGAADPATTFVYLYSRFGDTSGLPANLQGLGFEADDGDEHWLHGVGGPLSLATDLAVTKTDLSDTSIPGTPNSYTVTLTNNGPLPVGSVVFTDTVPTALLNPVFAPATGSTITQLTQSGNVWSGTWTFGAPLQPGQSIIMTVSGTIDPSATGVMRNTVSVYTVAPVVESNLTNNTAFDDTTLVPTGDLAVAKTDGQTTAVPGTPLTYTISVTNNGPSTFTSVILTDTPPAALLNPVFTPSAGSYDPGTGLWTGITLAAGQSVTMQLSGTVSPSATGQLVNTVTVAPPPGGQDSNPANNTATDTDQLTPQSDLSVTKTDIADEIFAGQLVAYFITVTNSGPSDVVGATITDIFPAEISSHPWFVLSASTGATATPSSGGPTDDLISTLNIPAGGTIVFQVDRVVAPGTPVGTVITNTVTVSVPPGDLTPGNNTDSHSDTVIGQPTVLADLRITKTHAPATAVPGETVTYTITVFNDGPNDVSGAVVTDTYLDASAFTLISWSRTGAGGTGPLSDTVDLPAGGSVVYTVVGTLSPSARGTVFNTATVTPPAAVSDPNTRNNRADDEVPLAAEADLSVAKTDGQTTAIPGTNVTYTITVTNNGPSTVTSVTLTDVSQFLLPGFTFTPSEGNYDSVTGLWTGLTLDPGTSVTLTLTGRIDPAATGTMTNSVTVTPEDATERNPADNSDSDTDTLVPTVDLSILKTDFVDTVIPGLTTTYTITLRNDGPSNAVGVRVRDVFPPEIIEALWTSLAAGGAAGNTPSGSGTIDDVLFLPTGASVVYTVVARISPTARGLLVNTAQLVVPPGVDEITPDNHVSTDTNTLIPNADLAVTKTASPAPVRAGQTLTYTITVTNNGPSTVTGFQLTETLPAEFAAVSFTPSAGTYDPATGLWSGLTLAAGESVTLTVTGTVAATARAALVNTAVVAPPADTNDYNPSNNTVTPEVPVQAQAQPVPPIPLVPDVSKRAFLASTLGNTTGTGLFRVAAADFNRDGVLDTVVGTPPGTPNWVQVVDGATGRVLYAFQPFESTYTGGVFVTTGDLTGDGVADVVITPDQGGGPRVIVLNGVGFGRELDFFGIDDVSFRGGARPAVGDVNGDGVNDLIVAAGHLGGPRVTVWDGRSLRAGTPVQLANFFAFEPTLREGVFVAAGDVDTDGFADLILGAGPGGAPRVRIASGRELLAAGPFANLNDVAGTVQLADFFAGDAAARQGVRVAYWDTDGDTLGEVVTSAGGATDVRAYDAAGVLAAPNGPAVSGDLDATLDLSLFSAVFVG